MKILTVVFSLGKGGTERAAQNFAVGYSRLGYDSRVLFTKLDGLRRNELNENGIPVYSLSSESQRRCLEDWKPNVVHIHSHLISIEEFHQLKELFNDSMFVETNVFSTPSPWADELGMSFQLSHWCEWIFQDTSKKNYLTAIVPYAVDCRKFACPGEQRIRDFRNKYGIGLDDIVLGRVGQDSDSKWSELLIKVFDQLKGRYGQLKLVIVNPPRSIIKKASESPFAADIIHIDKVVGDTNLVECYASFDIFLHVADRGESFGMVIAESLLCETPVVTLSTPWKDNSQGELVGNRVGGYVAATRHDLCPLTEKLIIDKELRSELGKMGRQRVLDLYCCEKIAEKAVRLFRRNEITSVKATPLSLAVGCEGKISYLTIGILFMARWVKLRRFRVLLRFTNRHWSWFYFPIFISQSLLRRLKRIALPRSEY